MSPCPVFSVESSISLRILHALLPQSITYNSTVIVLSLVREEIWFCNFVIKNLEKSSGSAVCIVYHITMYNYIVECVASHSVNYCVLLFIHSQYRPDFFNQNSSNTWLLIPLVHCVLVITPVTHAVYCTANLFCRKDKRWP